MSRDWESTFTAWSKGPGDTEQQRADNAERQIRQAIATSEKLKNRDIRVFAQGSYRNRVNVRRDSDVDIGVLCFDTYFPGYPDDNIKAQLEKSSEPATYAYATFKNELEGALVARFGREAVVETRPSISRPTRIELKLMLHHSSSIDATHPLRSTTLVSRCFQITFLRQ